MIATRIQLKTDTIENWTLNQNAVLLNGEAAVVQFPDKVTKLKIGDGVTPFKDLPYSFDTASIDFGYDSDEKMINLSVGGNVMGIDASDFIKDGMLSAVNYDNIANKLVLSFNTDAGTSPISVDLSSLVDIYTAGKGLSVVNNQFKIDEKVVATKSDLSSLSSELTESIKNKVTFRYWSES